MTITELKEKVLKEFDEKFKNGFKDYEHYEPEHQRMFEKDVKKHISKVIDMTVDNCKDWEEQ